MDSKGSPTKERAGVAERLECMGCRSGDLEVILSLGEMPLANGLVEPGQLNSPERRFPLEVAFCKSCALVQLTVSIPPEELFSEYAYLSSYADSVVANAETLVKRLINERALGSQSLAMEVASNDGYLLQHYVQMGIPVLGIDPARNIAPAAEEKGVPTLCAFFGVDVAEELRSSGRRASVVHANNVLAHVPDINGVVAGIERVLEDDGLAVIETPYLIDLVDRLEFDTIYHEHLFYYSLTALQRILSQQGLDVVDVERIPLHGGSIRVFASRSGVAASPTSAVTEMLRAEETAGVHRSEYYQGFARRVDALCLRVRTMLEEIRARGETIAGYGAAAKGAVLLNAARIDPTTIDFVVDRNPLKQGRYMPGVHIPIAAPDVLLERMPDYLLILAWNHAEEVMQQQMEYKKRGGRFILPIPEPSVV